MTIDEAIKRIESTKCFLKECSYENIKNTKFPEFMPLIKDEYEKNKYSLDSVITFLRAQAERDNPKPLTLDELRKMDGQPVWVVILTKIGDIKSSWFLVSDGYELNLQNSETYELYPDDTYEERYGEDYIAYRYPPKEAQP